MQATTLRNRAARIPPTFFERVRESGHPNPSLGSPAIVSGGAGLAHDAGNLLAALKLYADLLDAPGVLHPQHKHYATEIRGVADRSAQLLSSLMNDTGNDVTGIAGLPVGCPDCMWAGEGVKDLAAALGEWAPLLQSMAGAAAMVRVSRPEQLCVARPPLEAVERIVTNLVANAAKAIAGQLRKQPGRIKVSLRVFRQKLRLLVVDDGPGMPAGAVGKLLRHGLNPRGAQSGVGHRVVHELARATEGQLAVTSRPGEGTTVCVEWRLRNDSDQAGADTCVAIKPKPKRAGRIARMS